MIHAFNEVDHGAERGEGLRHLDPYRPAPKDHDGLRDVPDPRGLTIGPDAIKFSEPRDRRDHWLGSRRDDYLLSVEMAAVNFHHSRRGNPAVSADQFDAVLGEPVGLAAVVIVGNH